ALNPFALRFSDGKASGLSERFTLGKEATIQSIRRISELNFDILLSGHGEPLKPHVCQSPRVLFFAEAKGGWHWLRIKHVERTRSRCRQGPLRTLANPQSCPA
ncbi:hypothetical protein MUP77_24910, partial [Candidatus Bathyarchaeota archaeon]|nr:hypothetical protein [Candidatus Bathyarchaeota archaeon]